jgi:hypothetical protein
MIRWGQNGLAFNTDAGQVYLISGTFVAPAQQSRNVISNLHVQRTWKVLKDLSLPGLRTTSPRPR